MKARKENIAIWRLDDHRYAVVLDEVVRYVGSQEECRRRADILSPHDDRAHQDRAVLRACGIRVR